MKRICIVTGTRAEYGLLYWLIKSVHENSNLELQLIVTGMHLSPEFGLTWQQIKSDGFPISKKIEILLSSDTHIGISKSNALALISLSEAFDDLNPEIIILLGDRTETFAAAYAALIAGIPIAHIHGGELTSGAYDDSIRHCITKLSHLHFTSTEEYRNRVIQLGEQPSMVFNVGAIGLDNIKRFKLLSKIAFEEAINRNLNKINFLITFHPVTLENHSSKSQFSELLDALDKFENTLLIFTKPNSDKDGRIIIKMIDEYTNKNSNKSIAFTSMGQLLYLSALQFVDVVIGNSSSGIIEAPSFNVPTVNIGNRQLGRIAGSTILNCLPIHNDILNTINKALKFDRKKHRTNPYGYGNSSAKILKIITQIDEIKIKKNFYDIPLQNK